MKHVRQHIMVVSIVLLAALVAAAPLLAGGASIRIFDFDLDNCAAGTYAEGRVTFTKGSGDWYYLVFYNLTKGTASYFDATLALYSTAEITTGLTARVPALTEEGDEMRLVLSFEDAGGKTVARDSVHYYCGGDLIKGSSSSSSSEPPYTGVYLLSDAEVAPYLAVPTAEGDLPCGVFDVNGWGKKYVGMADFPACAAPVTVMCLNGDRQWTAANVSGVVMQGDWEVDFTSSQDGVCALFD